jgi:hypothetical protein
MKRLLLAVTGEGDEPGVAANMPKRPKGSNGFAADQLDEEFE